MMASRTFDHRLQHLSNNNRSSALIFAVVGCLAPCRAACECECECECGVVRGVCQRVLLVCARAHLCGVYWAVVAAAVCLCAQARAWRARGRREGGPAWPAATALAYNKR